MKISVLVDPRPNKREREYQVFLGQLFLKDLFDSEKDLTHITEMYLEYPERWLNILEIRVLYQAVELRCPNMVELSILTGSEHICTVTARENLRVMQNAQDFPEVPYSLGVRYCPKPDGSGNGLQIFTPK